MTRPALTKNLSVLKPKFNFSGHKFLSLENKTFWTNKKKEVVWKFTVGIFEFVKMQLLRLSEKILTSWYVTCFLFLFLFLVW